MAQNPNDVKNNVLEAFESFGYTPSEAELQEFINVDWTGMGSGAIANYVQAMQQLTGAEGLIKGNLLSEQQASQMYQNLSNILETQGTEAYNQAANIFTQAPQLFGSLSPDQVDTYLQPLKQQFGYATGQVEGDIAARGQTGSSIEGTALGQQENLFKQNVLSTGLGVGMQQQAQRAAILQALGSGKLGLSGTFGGLGANYSGLANQSAGQYGDLSQVIAGLGPSLENMAIGQKAAYNALNPPPGPSAFGSFLGTGLGFLTGGPIGANIGGNIASSITGNPMGARLGASVDPLSGLLGLNQTGAYGGQGQGYNPLQSIALLNLLRGGGGGGGSGNYIGGLDSAGATEGLPAAGALM